MCDEILNMHLIILWWPVLCFNAAVCWGSSLMDKNTKQVGKMVKKAIEQTEIYNGQCQTQVLLNIILLVYL